MIDGLAYTSTFGYDGRGRVTRQTYPDPASRGATQVTYDYDLEGFLWHVSVGGVALATLTGYSVLGQVGSIALRNGVTTTYRYYPEDNRLQYVDAAGGSAGPILGLTYEYDKVGNIAALRDRARPDDTQEFGYDEMDRLTSVATRAYTERNLTYSYDDPIRFHAVTSTSNGASYQYDANGNMTSDGSRTITYDYANRPVSFTAGGVNVLYGYEGAGHRVKKQVTSSAGTRTTVYAGPSFECTAGTCTRHVFVLGKRIASIADDGSIRYYHGDHLNSTRRVTNESGQLVESTIYAPFGGENAAGSAKFRFNSKELDPEAGLYYYGGRYYDAALRRFVTPDPYGVDPYDPQTLNRYAYVRNNPVNFIDPTGYQTTSVPYGDDHYECGVSGSCIYDDDQWVPGSTVRGGVPPISIMDILDPGYAKIHLQMIEEQYSLGSFGSGASGGVPAAAPTPPSHAFGIGVSASETTDVGLVYGAGQTLTDPLISRDHGFLKRFDYVTVGVGYFEVIGGGVHFTLDRHGEITWGWGAGVGLGGKGFGVSLGTFEGDAGTPVHGTRPSPEQLRALTTGWSTNLSAAFGPGIGVNWPWHSEYTATELQLQVPGFGLSAGKSYYITTVDMLSW